jgi:hypothetical protein
MDEYWDSNWLNVTARMEANGARVEATGPFLRNTEILSFLQELRTLHQTLKGSAELQTLEPELDLRFQGDGIGGIGVLIKLTPDHLNQTHTFEFGIDQTYLNSVIASCEAILESYPVRGTENQES